MKILFIHNRYKQYGGEDVAVELETSILIEKGHEVKTIYFDNTPVQGFFSKLATAIRSVYNFNSAKKISKTILQFKPDVVHIHNLFFIASPSILFAASKHKIPVILTLHNYRLICANALLLRDNKVCELCINKTFPFSGIRYKCYRNSRAETALVTAVTGVHKVINTWKRKVTTFVVSNEFSRNKLLNSSLHLPENKIVAKSNFVADNGQGKEQREEFFLFVGRVAKEKGVHILLETFSELPTQKVVIAGDGPERESLQAQYRSYPNIHFTGNLDKPAVLEMMKRCKALICPSIWYEVTPFTNFEAFSTGTPVIASRLGSMTGTIRDGYDGLHFTAGDAKDLRKKVELFLTQTENNADYYKNARQSYLEKYHPDVHYRSILSIYKNAITNYIP